MKKILWICSVLLAMVSCQEDYELNTDFAVPTELSSPASIQLNVSSPTPVVLSWSGGGAADGGASGERHADVPAHVSGGPLPPDGTAYSHEIRPRKTGRLCPSPFSALSRNALSVLRDRAFAILCITEAEHRRRSLNESHWICEGIPGQPKRGGDSRRNRPRRKSRRSLYCADQIPLLRP